MGFGYQVQKVGAKNAIASLWSVDDAGTQALMEAFYIDNDTELGWLLDPEDENILVALPERRIQILEGSQIVPVLSGIDLNLTVAQIFDWLSF